MISTLVFLACLFGLFTRPAGFSSYTWPANAVMLGMMIADPRARGALAWIGCFTAMILADLAANTSIRNATYLAIMNIASIAAGYVAFMFTKRKSLLLNSAKAVLHMVLIIATASTMSGIAGAWLGSKVFGAPGISYETWTATGFANYIAYLPVVLTARRLQDDVATLAVKNIRQGFMMALPAIALLCSCVAGLWMGGPGAIALPFPFLLWCALTYPISIVSILTAFVSLWTMVEVGMTFFQDVAHREDNLFSLRLGIAFTAIAPLLLASINAALQSGLKAQSQLAAIVASSYDAIISKDLDGTVTSWNKSAERMFGYSSGEIIGKRASLLYPENRPDEELGLLEQIADGKRVESFDTIRQTKAGAAIAVSITLSPIMFDERITGVSMIARDMTATKMNEKRITNLMHELNHRVKNQLAVVMSIVRGSAKGATSYGDLIEKVEGRIIALSNSHDLLVKSNWEGASIKRFLQKALKPFAQLHRIELAGPAIIIRPEALQNLGMAIHELGTNSAKYGALSGELGGIRISWSVHRSDDGVDRFLMRWAEDTGGGDLFATATEPGDQATVSISQGFGSTVLQRIVPQSLGGSALVEKHPGRLLWKLDVPLAQIVAS